MDVLLVESDPLIRDRVLVGLQQFPEIRVTVGEGYSALNIARQHSFDCIFLGVQADHQQGLRLIEHLRSFDGTTDVVVMSTERTARDMQQLKSRYRILAFLRTPLTLNEFFGLVTRLRGRVRTSSATHKVRS